MFRSIRGILACWVLGVVSPACGAAEFQVALKDLPTTSYLDRWMYPFNITPGNRIQAPVFGALGSEDFDERDGQLVIGIDTTALGIPSGLPPQQYRINSASLTLTETSGGYPYDPTYDPFPTYLDELSEAYQPDVDDGRPIELYGVGFRNRFSAFAWSSESDGDMTTFGSASPYSSGRGKRSRNLFAADASGADVSNSVDSLNGGATGFDPTPFAVARLVNDDQELSPGDIVTARTQWLFDIQVEDEAIHAYLANALSLGQLGLAVTSMHATGEQGFGDPFPNPATSNHFAYDGPVLFLDVDIMEQLLGDFNADSQLTADDIDYLSSAIRDGSSDTTLDLTGDGLITAADREAWKTLAGLLDGDVDFSGEVAFPDFLRLSQHFGEPGGWGQGDFDGDGQVAFPDFLVLSQNFGQTADVASVPEAQGTYVAIVACFCTMLRCRRRHLAT